MKIRIYAILPETPEDTWEPVSGKVECTGKEMLEDYITAVCSLYPDWLELNIERVKED